MAAVRGVGSRTGRPRVLAPADAGSYRGYAWLPVNGERARTARPRSARTRTRSPAGLVRTTVGFCEPPPSAYRMPTLLTVRNGTWVVVVVGMRPIPRSGPSFTPLEPLAKSLVIRPA